MSDAVNFLLRVYLNISSTIKLEPFKKFPVIVYLHPEQKSHIFLKEDNLHCKDSDYELHSV